jgi:hypothetical protein
MLISMQKRQWLNRFTDSDSAGLRMSSSSVLEVSAALKVARWERNYI